MAKKRRVKINREIVAERYVFIQMYNRRSFKHNKKIQKSRPSGRL